ncbi:atp-dependent rna helicase [Lasius niger]|uniref:Atp-dependent rna helicase n=1 Tax=Lasius niger TaxID=67767 RepID=A0A0J7KJR1_LASNI|nr:atp-dependent rna helicase [Lasius niger]
MHKLKVNKLYPLRRFITTTPRVVIKSISPLTPEEGEIVAKRKTRSTPLHVIAAKRRRTGAQSPTPGVSRPVTEKVTSPGTSRLATGASRPAAEKATGAQSPTPGISRPFTKKVTTPGANRPATGARRPATEEATGAQSPTPCVSRPVTKKVTTPGASRPAIGASRLDTGASRLDTGASRLDTGASRLGTGTSRRDTGTSRQASEEATTNGASRPTTKEATPSGIGRSARDTSCPASDASQPDNGARSPKPGARYPTALYDFRSSSRTTSRSATPDIRERSLTPPLLWRVPPFISPLKHSPCKRSPRTQSSPRTFRDASTQTKKRGGKRYRC